MSASLERSAPTMTCVDWPVAKRGALVLSAFAAFASSSFSRSEPMLRLMAGRLLLKPAIVGVTSWLAGAPSPSMAISASAGRSMARSIASRTFASCSGFLGRGEPSLAETCGDLSRTSISMLKT